ncbi:uncharacterized protein LOC105438717 [Strongylocentrotus purpuratus]|uniref:Uncharacterized protein n=1 Tax=Strongylocentrotus purpuratus TaxID=7668 RepID=A0A7M7NVT0_STRPU|nr:uncharacterized protein LOC105438717 [Strongylocentrotus purpuratus]
MRRCQMSTSQMGYSADMSSTDTLLKIQSLLPVHLQARWASKAHVAMEQSVIPNFSHMTDFIEQEAKIASNVFGKNIGQSFKSSSSAKRQKGSVGGRASSFAMEGGTDRPNNRKEACPCCKKEHQLETCFKLRDLPQKERFIFLKKSGICFNCLKKAHLARNCPSDSTCKKEGCSLKWKHHTWLHFERKESPNQKNNEDSPSQQNGAGVTTGVECHTIRGRADVRLRVLPVKVRHGAKEVTTWALLDEGSDTSLCEKRLAEELGIVGVNKEFRLTTINGMNTPRKGMEVSMTIQGLQEDTKIDVDRMWTVDVLPISSRSIPCQEDVDKWPHLQGIQLVTAGQAKVQLLIGGDTPEAFWVEEERRGQKKDPYAIRTPLGWTFIGPASSSSHRNSYEIHHISAEELQNQVKRFWEMDSGPGDERVGESVEDVDTLRNSADDGSQGIPARSLDRWLTGPEFLLQEKEVWPEDPASLKKEDVPELDLQNDSEVKKTHVYATSSHDEIDDLMTRYSSWDRLKRGIAWLLRYKQYLRSKGTGNLAERGSLTVQELNNAEVEVIKHVQRRSFPDEYVKGIEKKTRKQGNPLEKLNPVMVDGLLRVGGRLSKAPILNDEKHPMILPNDHHVTKLLVVHHHQKVGHCGMGSTWTSLRERFWINKGGATVRHTIGNCFKCRKRNASRGQQFMADLPEERVTPGEPPFTNTGLDYFGPFPTKHGRSTQKRYGCIFTCLSTRAVHLEMAYSLETDSFIQTLRRFINRRGQPKAIFSDNGTNFKGGQKELKDALAGLNSERVNRYLTQKGIAWHFNPPGASHMGGVWERIIRSVRKILTSLPQQTLTDEALLTLFTEVEAILNGRPLTHLSMDSRDDEPLTPNHLLLLRKNPSLPPGIFVKEDCHLRRHWRQVQYLAGQFWTRWVKEYLPLLQQRQKWTRPNRNFEVDDLVLVVNESTPRGQWPIGRVLTTYPDKRGLVRQVEVRVGPRYYKRPISKLCLLEANVEASS